jgi:hypothetical protein
MRELKLSALKGACESQRDKFKKLFGKSVMVTEELAIKHAQDFDWSWAAKYLLSEPARAEYERVRAPALAVYNNVLTAAWAEYSRATEPAWAEYSRAIATALEEYDKANATARAEYNKAMAPAFAKAYIGDGETQ